MQIVEWYDELIRLTDSPVHGSTGPWPSGRPTDPGPAWPPWPGSTQPARYTAAMAYLHERDGDHATAARLYAEAARSASNLAERDHLTRQAARLNAQPSKRQEDAG